MEDQIGLYWLVIQRTAACCLPRRSTPLILHGLYDTLPGMVGGIGVARSKTLWNGATYQASRGLSACLPPVGQDDPQRGSALRQAADGDEDRGDPRSARRHGVRRVGLKLVQPAEG